jgi:hypothetical protein
MALCLQHGAIHGKILIAELRLDLRRAHQLLQKAAHHRSLRFRSRFVVKVVGCQIGSLELRLTNQRYSRL